MTKGWLVVCPLSRRGGRAQLPHLGRWASTTHPVTVHLGPEVTGCDEPEPAAAQRLAVSCTQITSRQLLSTLQQQQQKTTNAYQQCLCGRPTGRGEEPSTRPASQVAQLPACRLVSRSGPTHIRWTPVDQSLSSKERRKNIETDVHGRVTPHPPLPSAHSSGSATSLPTCCWRRPDTFGLLETCTVAYRTCRLLLSSPVSCLMSPSLPRISLPPTCPCSRAVPLTKQTPTQDPGSDPDQDPD